jgi:Zn-dependent protease
MLTSDLLIRIPALLLALTFHEVAHGLVAFRLGDPTAKYQGRLTLNPLAHLDPLGLLALWLFGFGWAKPVPVNPAYFRGDKQRGMFLVGLAGPATNFLMAFIVRLLTVSMPVFHAHPILLGISEATFIYNIFLGVFNLLPVPPLDGSKVFAYLLPRSMSYIFGQLEQYGPLILILLIVTGSLTRILLPMAALAVNLTNTVVAVLTGGY